MSGNEEESPQDKCPKDQKFSAKSHSSAGPSLTQSLPAEKINPNVDQSQSSPIQRRTSESTPSAPTPHHQARSAKSSNADTKAFSNQAIVQKQVNLLTEIGGGLSHPNPEPRLRPQGNRGETRERLNMGPGAHTAWGDDPPDYEKVPGQFEHYSARGFAEYQSNTAVSEQRLRSECDKLRREKDELVNQREEDQRRLGDAAAESNRLYSELDETRKKMTLESEKVIYYENQFKVQKTKREKMEVENDKLRLECNSLREQIGKNMHQKLAGDDTKLENIHSRNRPSKIADDYRELTTSILTDAKDELDEMFPEDRKEEAKLRFLNNIAMSAEEFALKHLKRYRASCEQLLSQPLSYMTVLAQGQPSKLSEDFSESLLGKELKFAVVTNLKENSDNIDIKQLAEDVCVRIRKDSLMSLMASNAPIPSAVAKYITEICRISWRMVTQTPPMSFNASGMGDIPVDGRHTLHYACRKKPDQVVSTFMYPVLEHRDKCLAKGLVFTVSKKEYKSKK